MNKLINLTVKLSKRIVTVFCLCILTLLLVFFDFHLSKNDDSKIQVGQLSQRIEYINTLGFSVDETSEKENQIHIPKNFNQAFEAFNNDLKAQGFDLEKIKGETVKRYTYKAKSGENISLFVYNNTLVGYDIRED